MPPPRPLGIGAVMRPLYYGVAAVICVRYVKAERISADSAMTNDTSRGGARRPMAWGPVVLSVLSSPSLSFVLCATGDIVTIGTYYYYVFFLTEAVCLILIAMCYFFFPFIYFTEYGVGAIAS
jgi:hypothetical protein